MMSVGRAVFALGLCALVLPASAADLKPPPPPVPPAPAFLPGWTYRVTPYGWLTSLNGSQMVRGRGVNINATFPQIVDATLGSGGSLIALMVDMEARNGPVALFADIIGEKIAISRSGVKTKTVAPGVTGTLGAAVDLQFQMGIVEAGGAYQFARLGPVEFDVLAGARYWYQKIDVGFNVATTVDRGDLVLRGAKAIARSGSVDWIDAFAGLRARVSLTPTQHIEVRGDLGGGGSKFTWNALAVYAYDFTTRSGVTYSAILGYKALYVDYVQGSGRSRYEFDMLQHGPVLGLSIRF
jgi:hypothetical protein